VSVQLGAPSSRSARSTISPDHFPAGLSDAVDDATHVVDLEGDVPEARAVHCRRRLRQKASGSAPSLVSESCLRRDGASRYTRLMRTVGQDARSSGDASEVVVAISRAVEAARRLHTATYRAARAVDACRRLA
jgi:hypothetical protein